MTYPLNPFQFLCEGWATQEEEGMARRKRHSSEYIIGLLRAIEVAVAQGLTVVELCRAHVLADQTDYRCVNWQLQRG